MNDEALIFSLSKYIDDSGLFWLSLFPKTTSFILISRFLKINYSRHLFEGYNNAVTLFKCKTSWDLLTVIPFVKDFHWITFNILCPYVEFLNIDGLKIWNLWRYFFPSNQIYFVILATFQHYKKMARIPKWPWKNRGFVIFRYLNGISTRYSLKHPKTVLFH